MTHPASPSTPDTSPSNPGTGPGRVNATSPNGDPTPMPVPTPGPKHTRHVVAVLPRRIPGKALLDAIREYERELVG